MCIEIIYYYIRGRIKFKSHCASTEKTKSPNNGIRLSLYEVAKVKTKFCTYVTDLRVCYFCSFGIKW